MVYTNRTKIMGKENMEYTKKYQTNTYNPKNSKKRKKKSKWKQFKQKHPKFVTGMKVAIILLLLLMVIGAGVIAGMFFGLFGDQFEITQKDLAIAASNSIVVDANGEQIADLSGDEKRKIITLDEMSEYLPKAYVAIEDERFYKHHGVDFKRTAGAAVTYIFNRGNSSFGGSTITQQLVKNITNDKEDSGLAGIMRKVKEWAKAYQVERMISKDQILELYLNILFVGSNNLHGVELGAEYYFDKSAKDLSLAECAFLAGINHSPNSYNPYGENDHKDKIKTRTKTVLNKMKELGYINDEEFEKAEKQVDKGLKFKKAKFKGNQYSYHTEAAISQVVEQVAEEKNISKELAENYVYSSGLTIHSTQDTKIQERMEDEFEKTSQYARKSRKTKDEDGNYVNTQAAMVIIDHKNGNVVGCVGGLGEKEGTRGLNRATQITRQPGSAIKPIADVAPALEEGIITTSTVYDDSKTEFSGGYTPKNYNRFRGLINIREFIETSQNIPAVKIMAELTPKKSIEYMEKMGISSLDEKNDNVLPLAIGGMTNGISPLEMAAAYATIANNGEYISPTFYSKVTDVNGAVVLTPNQTKERVISEGNAYLTKDILTEPVVGGSGTAKYCSIPGMSVAAKTGTTNDDYDRWLCGFTEYYAAATWYGFDKQETVYFGGSNPAGRLWSNIMKDIHEPLENAKFKKPASIVTATVCKDTGELATEKCKNTYSEIFVKGNLPDKCEGHGNSYRVCSESGLLATQYCPSTKLRYASYDIPKEQKKLWKTSGGKASGGKIPTETCDIHTKPEAKEEPKEEVKEENKNTTKKNETTTNTATTDGNKEESKDNTTKPENTTPEEKPDEEEPEE